MNTAETTFINDFSQVSATELLDLHFPLRSGTHSEVSTYLVYFDHLMAIQTDGSTTSLVTPSQFDSADGSLDGPCAIVLDNGETRVQIRMRSCRKEDNSLHPCIEDMRVRTLLRAS